VFTRCNTVRAGLERVTQGRIYSKRGPCSEKMWGPYYMNTLSPDCLHPTHTLVIIDILLKTRASMHTTIAAADVWRFEARF